MDENNGIKNEPNVNTEEIKREVKETATEVKKAVKNTDFKKDAKEAKNFVTNFLKTPFTELKKVVTNPKSFLKIAIIIFVIWVVAKCIDSIIEIFNLISYSPYYNFSSYARNSFSDFLSVLKAILSPAISVILLSGIIYLSMKDKKKNYLTIITTIVITQIPVIFASIISLLGYISTQAKMVTSSISSFCSVISAVFVYFALKALYSENDDDKIAKTFIVTMAIYYVIALILKFFTIYI